MKHKKTLSLKPFRLTYGAMPFALMAMAASPVNADSYQLNLTNDGAVPLTAAEAIISAAHEDGVLSTTDDLTWNNYSLNTPAAGVTLFDQSGTAANVLLEANTGADNNVTFRYSEGVANVDFSLGFTAGGANPAEDTTNPGNTGTAGNGLYTELWFTRPGDLGHGFQFKGLPAGLYEVYVYGKESNALNRVRDVTFQVDLDDESSQVNGVSNGIGAGNNATGFTDGTTHTKQIVNVPTGQNLVVFVSAVESATNSSVTFASVAAIQIVGLPPVDDDNDNLPDEWELVVQGAADLNVFNGLLPAGGGPGDNTGDFDGDGLSDLEEFQNNTNPREEDTDGDTLTDLEETSGSENPYQVGQLPGEAPLGAPGAPTNPLVSDTDGDGIRDDEEIVLGGDSFITNPNLSDTDGDTMPDNYEVENDLNPTTDDSTGDLDLDTLTNLQEFTGGTNPNDIDSDDDGLRDDLESVEGSLTDPNITDTDGDGLADGAENEDFADGMGVPVADIDQATRDDNPGILFDDIPGGLIYGTDPSESDTDGDTFSDFIEVAFGNSDPTDSASIPVFEPVVASIQFDCDGGPGGNNFQGAYAPDPTNGDTIQAPAHALGLLGDSDRFFNNVSGDVNNSSLVATDGSPLPGLSIDFGTETGGTYNFAEDLGSSGFAFTQPVATPIHLTPLYRDWLFTNADKNLVARVKGLAAGSYRVITLNREATDASANRTYNASFGTQAEDGSTDPVLTITRVGVGGVPATFTENTNFFSADVTIADNEYIVISIDPTNAAFGNLEGLQIFPTPAVTGNDIVVTSAAFNGTDFEVSVDGLTAGTDYVLTRSATLDDGFPTTVDTLLDAPAATATFRDMTAPVGKAFYRVEVATP